MRRECDLDSGGPVDAGGPGGTGMKKQPRIDACSPHSAQQQQGQQQSPVQQQQQQVTQQQQQQGQQGPGNPAGGGPPGSINAVNMFLPPTPFQENLVASNPFDDSHIATAHLKGNLAKNFPPGKGMQPVGGNGSPLHHQSPCGMCHKEVHDNEQAVLCESGCALWFHRICTGLTEAAFHLLAQEAPAEWVCDRCVQTRNVPLVRFKQ